MKHSSWSRLAVFALLSAVCSSAQAQSEPYYMRQSIPMPVKLERLDRFHVTSLGQVITDTTVRPDIERGAVCPQNVTHTDASFEGGSYNAQAGFAQGEWAAVTYTVPASAFPLQINTIEMIFATSGATVQTTTHWSVGVWSGNPQTGTQVALHSSDGKIIPHIVLQPGTNGVDVLFQVDPGDPEQIIVQAPADGSNSFTVGYRIDQHNNQVGNPCFTAPSSSMNAFPTTDIGGLAQPSNNWLFGLNCGAFGCPANGGWARFSSLNVLCRPSGDWVIRASYQPFSCPTATGRCCMGVTTCQQLTFPQCQAAGGLYGGDGTSCSGFSCPFGACCLPTNSCVELTEANCTNQGGCFQGVGVTCAQTNCQGSPRACCFPATNGCLNNITPQQCATLNGFSGPPCSTCANYVCFPTGACCLLNGSCVDGVSPNTCTAQGGTWRGNGTLCSQVVCPPQTGACCVGIGCIELTALDCVVVGGTWGGGGSDCDDNNGNKIPDSCEAGCPGDANGDHVTNAADLSVLLGQFGSSVQVGTGADFNTDGVVNAADLSILLGNFNCGL